MIRTAISPRLATRTFFIGRECRGTGGRGAILSGPEQNVRAAAGRENRARGATFGRLGRLDGTGASRGDVPRRRQCLHRRGASRRVASGNDRNGGGGGGPRGPGPLAAAGDPGRPAPAPGNSVGARS